MKLTPASKVERMIESSSISFGGVAAKTIRAVAVEDALTGKPWCSATFKVCCKFIDRILWFLASLDRDKADMSWRSFPVVGIYTAIQ